MLDIDDQVRRVWSPDVRPLIAEAWRCYGIGAHRATITFTWLAVCEDLAEKIIRLADDGDGVAAAARVTIELAHAQGLTPAGFKAMQDLERSLLSTAVTLELVDTITSRELARLREDRHLCVHPSLRGEVYEPRAESAREHLSAALSGLLTVPGTQGRKAVDRFTRHVADPSFTPTSEYLLQTFFGHVRRGVKKGIVELAVKHAARRESDGVATPNGQGVRRSRSNGQAFPRRCPTPRVRVAHLNRPSSSGRIALWSLRRVASDVDSIESQGPLPAGHTDLPSWLERRTDWKSCLAS
jgi:hypothetical protein